MTDDIRQRRENDALQSGEGNPAYGQDTRDFGEGGQTVEQPLGDREDEPENRDVTRDRSLDPAHESPVTGTASDPRNDRR